VGLASTRLFRAPRRVAWRAKRDRGERGWLKWVFATWLAPQVVLA
jgi:hypothetical protein